MHPQYSTYNESVFRSSVQGALQRVQSILDTTRHPRLAEHEDHQYDDKYALAEFVTNSANAAMLNVLQDGLGLNEENLAKITKWAKEDKKTVTLRFEATDGCLLMKEQEVKKVFSPEIETETTSTTTYDDDKNPGSIRKLFVGSNTKTEKTTTRVTHTVKEYHWKVEVSYKIHIFAGVSATNDGDDSGVELESRHVFATVVTAGGGVGQHAPTSPIPNKTVHPPIDINLTWLFANLDGSNNGASRFAIERNDVETCKTPRRNNQVQKSVDMYEAVLQWANNVRDFVVDRLAHTIDESHQPIKASSNSGVTSTIEVGTRCKLQGMVWGVDKHVHVTEVLADGDQFVVEPVNGDGLPPSLPPSLTVKRANLAVLVDKPGNVKPLWELNYPTIFVPILPLMENGSILSEEDTNKLLNEQTRSMKEAIKSIQTIYPPKSVAKVISTMEATLVTLSLHLKHLSKTYIYSVDYIEGMLRDQLIQAIGKKVHPGDFEQFMRFHHNKLFAPCYAPKPFTYAIRQPNRYPDGILSVEGTTMDGKVEPVVSLVRHVPVHGASPPISIPISAATSVEITGDQYIHGWMQHRFESSSSSTTKYELAARARQFCSFMIIVGTMAGPDKFQPKDAIILQNKDEVLIPLLTKMLPSAKEFKDAIASLSPEQQAFARAFRSMQLETSVFAVCVIQIKPQLEKLLGLSSGALTKEIQLTQDLMSLFIDYQIPSDLLSFEGAPETDMAAKLTAVKSYVKSVIDVVDGAKEKQLIEEERKADMREEVMSFAASNAGTLSPALFDSYGSHSSPKKTQGAFRGTDRVGRAREPAVYSPRQPAGGRVFGSAPAPPFLGSSPSVADRFHSAPAPPRLDSSPPVADGPHSSCNDYHFGISEDEAQESSTGGDVSQLNQSKDQGIQQNQALQVWQKGETPDNDDVEDYTMIPKLLDAKLEVFDTDSSLRPTVIETGSFWTRKRQENLLTAPQKSSISPSVIQDEKKKAFDLLDALSRSGTLPIACAELHVMVGITHCFENDVMGTVIQDNINPIDKVEKSLLLLASTIFREPAKALLSDDRQLHERLTASFPQLLVAPRLDE